METMKVKHKRDKDLSSAHTLGFMEGYKEHIKVHNKTVNNNYISKVLYKVAIKLSFWLKELKNVRTNR